MKHLSVCQNIHKNADCLYRLMVVIIGDINTNGMTDSPRDIRTLNGIMNKLHTSQTSPLS